MTKPMTKTMERRKLIRETLGYAGAVLSVAALSRVARADQCAITPEQPEGPFYPVDLQVESDADLTVLAGRTAPALGQVIYVAGIVRDDACKPVPNALVEIWQAAASGRYNHPGDDSPLTPDPNFQGWGKALTDEQGRYMFKTIIPGKYPASQTWERPPHIHFKVSRRGYHELITQMYFAGNPLNDADLIRRSLSPSEQAAVTVALTAGIAGQDPGAKNAHFDLAIVKVV